jgi:hypothetical protein
MPTLNLYGSQVVELYAFAAAMNYRNLSGLKYCRLQSNQVWNWSQEPVTVGPGFQPEQPGTSVKRGLFKKCRNNHEAGRCVIPKNLAIPTNERDLREGSASKDLHFSFWVELRFSPAITTREGIGLSR